MGLYTTITNILILTILTLEMGIAQWLESDALPMSLPAVQNGVRFSDK